MNTQPLPILQKLGYSMGGVSMQYMNNLLPMLALPIFSVGLGVPAWKMGLALSLPRVWDAISDPIIGHLSDSTHTRWGRRRPFMLIGALTVLLTFPMLFIPTPSWDKSIIFWWFMGFSVLYYTGTTLFAIPFNALGYEIASDSKERAKLMTFRSFITSIFLLGNPWIYAMCYWQWDALWGEGRLINRLTTVVSNSSKTLVPPGYQIVCIGMAIFMAISGLCVLCCKENLNVVATDRKQFMNSCKKAFCNKPFILLCSGLVFAMFGIFLIMPLATYINIYYMFGGNQAEASAMLAKVGTVQSLAGLLLVPLCGYLITRFGAVRMMKIYLIVTAVSFIIKYWTYTPSFPWLQTIPLMMWSFSWSGTMLAFNVMLGDICDYDDYHTGERREGMYSAIFQFLTKLVIALSTAACGMVLSFSGIVAGVTEQTERSIWLMRIEFSLVPFLVVLIGSIAFFYYPLTEAKADQIREELAQRKINKK